MTAMVVETAMKTSTQIMIVSLMVMIRARKATSIGFQIRQQRTTMKMAAKIPLKTLMTTTTASLIYSPTFVKQVTSVGLQIRQQRITIPTAAKIPSKTLMMTTTASMIYSPTFVQQVHLIGFQYLPTTMTAMAAEIL